MTIQARVGDFQGLQAIRADVAYNTPGIANGLLFGKLPKDSFLVAIAVDVTAAFDATVTNVLTIGTDAASANQIADATALAETAGGQLFTPIAGFSHARTAETPLYVKYAQTGTAAGAGAATILVIFAVNLPASVPTGLET